MGATTRAALVALAAVALAGCAKAGDAVVNAASKDPMKCERDPKCSRYRSSYVDCTQQCVDDPECMRLCEQIQQRTDSMAH